MLESSFCCFNGISTAAERRLWQSGIRCWEDALRWPHPVFSTKKWGRLCEDIRSAKIAYENECIDYFANRLTGSNRARLLHDYGADFGYLDIETEGLEQSAPITTVAVYFREELHLYVEGKNLEQFLELAGQCRVWVTFNGASFDLPRLRRRFKIDLNQPHIDLMHVLRGLGFRGGLKNIEKSLKIDRPFSKGCDGGDAVRLWAEYTNDHNAEALHKLLLYNAEDCLVMYALLRIAYNQVMSAYPAYKFIPINPIPEIRMDNNDLVL